MNVESRILSSGEVSWRYAIRLANQLVDDTGARLTTSELK
jgi:hypothetical protein